MSPDSLNSQHLQPPKPTSQAWESNMGDFPTSGYPPAAEHPSQEHNPKSLLGRTNPVSRLLAIMLMTTPLLATGSSSCPRSSLPHNMSMQMQH